MKLVKTLKLLTIIAIILIIIYYLHKSTINNHTNAIIEKNTKINGVKKKIEYKRNEIVLAVVTCGDERFYETLTLIKSALMFTKEQIHIVIVANDELHEKFHDKLKHWRLTTTNTFTYRILSIEFPNTEWKQLFKPCAAQRLFLPNILNDVDSILYMDTDTLLLTPIEQLWNFFNKMNDEQMAAVSLENGDDPNLSWYYRFARHPFYGVGGVNSGVMLMNLTRMRTFDWNSYLQPIYNRWRLMITWGDQDIINIIFHYHPKKLLIMECRWNYRPDFCIYTSLCGTARKEGVAVVHGSRAYLHKNTVFNAIYRAFDEFEIGSGDIFRDFYEKLESYLDDIGDDKNNCKKERDLFLMNLRKFIDIK